MHEGEIVGLTGLIGSGFEEVAYLLYGARSARAGRLVLRGEDNRPHAPDTTAATRSGIALIPADRKTDGSVGSLPVVENLALAVLDRYFNGVSLELRRMRRETRALMQEFDVRPNDPSLPYGALSGGNQQKALLAKWFQTEPRLLLLDEPTQGVDVGARQQIFGLIRDRGRGARHARALREQRLRAALPALRPRDRLRPRPDLARARGRRRDEGADHRAELRSHGGRGRGGRRLSATAATEPRRALRSLADLLERYALLAVWGVVVVVFGILRPDTFLTTANFSTIFGSQAVLVVLTLALLPPLTAGDYDLSVAARWGSRA